MKEAIDNVELNLADTEDACFKDQRNVIITRPRPGGKMQIVVCPATLLTGDVGEIAGALATALGHAIDPCALDSMSVGDVSLAALLDPLRACVGSKIGVVGQNILPPATSGSSIAAERTVATPAGNAPAYLRRLKSDASGFRTLPQAPHCPAPLTADELSRLVRKAKAGGAMGVETDNSASTSIAQRDQSNAAVAQFFGDKALAAFLRYDELASRPSKASPTGRTLSARDNSIALARSAFAPYCDEIYFQRAGHPDPAKLLNEIVGRDPELMALACPARLGLASNKSSIDVAEKNYLKAPTLAKSYPASCDAMLAAGFGAYGRDLKNKDGALSLDGGSGGPMQGLGLAGAGAGLGGNGAGSVSGAGHAGSVAGGEAGQSLDLADAKFNPNYSSATLQDFGKRLQFIESQRAKLNPACIEATTGVAPATVVRLANKACGSKTTGYAAVDIGEATMVPVAGDAAFKFQCRATCACDSGRPALNSRWCYNGEETFLGEIPLPKIDPAKPINPAAVVHDIEVITAQQPEKGVFSNVTKACLDQGPSASEAVKLACASKAPGAFDAQGRAIIPVKEPVVFVGEVSGVDLKFGCTLHCACHDNSGCLVEERQLTLPTKATLLQGSPDATQAIRLAKAKDLAVSPDELQANGGARKGQRGLAAENPGSASAGLSSPALAVASSASSTAMPQLVGYNGDVAPALSDSDDKYGTMRAWDDAYRNSHAEAEKECTEQVLKEECRDPLSVGSKPIPPLGSPELMVSEQWHATEGKEIHSGTLRFSLRYRCDYDCANHQYHLQLAHESPAPSELQGVDLKTTTGLRTALRADWFAHQDELNEACANFLVNLRKHPDTEQFRQFSADVQASCKDHRFPLRYDSIFFTPFAGEVSGAHVPFECNYSDEVCSGPAPELAANTRGKHHHQQAGNNKSLGFPAREIYTGTAVPLMATDDANSEKLRAYKPAPAESAQNREVATGAAGKPTRDESVAVQQNWQHLGSGASPIRNTSLTTLQSGFAPWRSRLAKSS